MASAMSFSTARSTTWPCAQLTTARRACIGVSRAALKDHAAWGTSRRYPVLGRLNPFPADRDRNCRDGARAALRGTDLDVPDPLQLTARATARDRLEHAVAHVSDHVRGVAQAGRDQALRDDLDRRGGRGDRLGDGGVDAALDGPVGAEQ